MTFKKFLSFILACCMIMAVLSLTACGGKDNGDDNNNPGENPGIAYQPSGDNYVITVVDEDNNPVKGVKFTFSNGSNVFLLAETNDEGKAIAPSSIDGSVGAMILSVPDGYEKPDKISGSNYHIEFKAGEKSATLVLKKLADNTLTYTVKVVDQNGEYVEGIEVQLCYDGICLPAVATDSKGEITKNITTTGTISILLYDLEGYTLPEKKDGYHEFVEAGQTSIVIEITKN